MNQFDAARFGCDAGSGSEIQFGMCLPLQARRAGVISPAMTSRYPWR